MSATPTTIHVELDISTLDDQRRADALAAIQELAPASVIYIKNPAVQAAVSSLGAAGDALKASSGVVAADEKKLALDKQTLVENRANFDKVLVLLKNLVENAATSDAELKSMGLKPRGPRPVEPLLPPPGITVKLGKIPGQFTVSAQETGSRKRYAAQMSENPGNPGAWTELPGHGKSRLVKGLKSGTVVWVQFAVVRGQGRSEWCKPVPITVP
ncbi:MAG: hypothetical protein QM820_00945 [Minicystis sp.]